MHAIDPLYSGLRVCRWPVGGNDGGGRRVAHDAAAHPVVGVHPATAVGTDLLFAAATKTGGSLVHGLARHDRLDRGRRLASGSVPSTVLTLLVPVPLRCQWGRNARPDHHGAERCTFVTAGLLIYAGSF